MTSKYAIHKLNVGWGVTTATNGHIVAKFLDTETQAASIRDRFERGEITVDQKPEVWVIGKSFVMEPYLGGTLNGEVGKLDMAQYEVVRQMTQAAFDKAMMKYFEKPGGFPDSLLRGCCRLPA
jgi:hypothetical protein